MTLELDINPVGNVDSTIDGRYYIKIAYGIPVKLLHRQHDPQWPHKTVILSFKPLPNKPVPITMEGKTFCHAWSIDKTGEQPTGSPGLSDLSIQPISSEDITLSTIHIH